MPTGPTEDRVVRVGGWVCLKGVGHVGCQSLGHPCVRRCVMNQGGEEPSPVHHFAEKNFGGNFYQSIMTCDEMHKPYVYISMGFYLRITSRQRSRTFTDPSGHLVPPAGQYLARKGKDFFFLVGKGTTICFASFLAPGDVASHRMRPFVSVCFCSGRGFRTHLCRGVSHGFSLIAEPRSIVRLNHNLFSHSPVGGHL